MQSSLKESGLSPLEALVAAGWLKRPHPIPAPTVFGSEWHRRSLQSVMQAFVVVNVVAVFLVGYSFLHQFLEVGEPRPPVLYPTVIDLVLAFFVLVASVHFLIRSRRLTRVPDAESIRLPDDEELAAVVKDLLRTQGFITYGQLLVIREREVELVLKAHASLA